MVTIPVIENKYATKTLAQRFEQGRRTVYSFALDLATLDGLLPQRVEENVIKDANRRLTPSHAKAIQVYLANRPDWVLGALLLGIAPDALEFVPVKDESGKESASFGELRILADRINTMRIFDGQHRRRAIADALVELEHDKSAVDKYASLRNAAVPIVLYAEDDINALRQMFADAAKIKPIESNTLTRFDEHDAFNLTAIRVANESKLFAERVEMERTTVRRSSERLIAINQLAATLKTLSIGYSARVSKKKNSDYMSELDTLYQPCLAWSDEFMPAARDEYRGLIDGTISTSDIPTLRPTTFAFNAVFIRILAGCYWDWTQSQQDWQPLATFVRESILKPGAGSEEGSLLVSAGVVVPGGITPLPRTQEVRQAIQFIVKSARSTI